MKEWKIPMTWEMYGICKIEAETLEEAKEKALHWATSLPEGNYIDDSARLDEEEIIAEMNGEPLTL